LFFSSSDLSVGTILSARALKLSKNIGKYSRNQRKKTFLHFLENFPTYLKNTKTRKTRKFYRKFLNIEITCQYGRIININKLYDKHKLKTRLLDETFCMEVSETVLTNIFLTFFTKIVGFFIGTFTGSWIFLVSAHATPSSRKFC